MKKGSKRSRKELFRGIELEIPPFGTFRMDLQQLTQTTVRGRNPGYEPGSL